MSSRPPALILCYNNANGNCPPAHKGRTHKTSAAGPRKRKGKMKKDKIQRTAELLAGIMAFCAALCAAAYAGMEDADGFAGAAMAFSASSIWTALLAGYVRDARIYAIARTREDKASADAGDFYARPASAAERAQMDADNAAQREEWIADYGGHMGGGNWAQAALCADCLARDGDNPAADADAQAALWAHLAQCAHSRAMRGIMDAAAIGKGGAYPF